MSTTRIPAQAVNILREALIGQLGLAAAAVQDASTRPDHERHPEWFQQPLAELDRCRGALDAIGWKQPDKQPSITLELAPHRLVISKALQARLEIERDYLNVDPSLFGAEAQRRIAAGNAEIIETILRVRDLATIGK